MAPIAFPVFGTALGAKLAGARFGPALAGSVAGLFVGVLPLAATVVDLDNVLSLAIPVAIQASITTLLARGWH